MKKLNKEDMEALKKMKGIKDVQASIQYVQDYDRGCFFEVMIRTKGYQGCGVTSWVRFLDVGKALKYMRSEVSK